MLIKRIFLEFYYLERTILFHFISPTWKMEKGGFLNRILDIAWQFKYSFINIAKIIYWNTKTEKYIQNVSV